MFLVDRIVLIASVLILMGIVSSKFSARLGLPVLVLFLGLGMLAGEEGIGRIHFDSFELAHAVGTLALAAILFDGGLRTPIESIRIAWRPASLLATIGVLGTSCVTGVAASRILGVSLLEGVLLGGIVGSTDAAAVFALLRSAGVRLRERLAATLEIESGSNDPMAIFLTIGLLEVLLGRRRLGIDLLELFVLQFGVGIVAGLLVGKVAVRVVNRINLGAAGLYPVLTGGCGLLSFGIAASVGGSGFLAIYLTGIVLGNSRLVFQRGTFLFHDGIAWVGQITMFVLLGLLSTPSALFAVAGEGFALAAVLIFIARPLAVVPLLIPFDFSVREMVLVAWAGLKGAVPIILATFPLLFGLPDGALLFNVVFFVVFISAVTQGWSIPWLARRLGLESGPPVITPITLEITSLKDVDADIVEYTVGADCRGAGRRLSELALPDGVVVAMIARGTHLIPPRGSTRIAPSDHVFVVLRPESRTLLDRVFSSRGANGGDEPIHAEVRFQGATRVRELSELYGIRLHAPEDTTLDELLRSKSGDVVECGSALDLDGTVLRAREVVEGRVTSVGLITVDHAPPLAVRA